ncbi:MAG: hypothetical protein ACRD0Q_00950 [Acidimicrobiales bacterium]
MAVYIPASRRRQWLVLVAVAAALLGALLGGLAGRATAPSVDERVREVQERARTLTAGLRVLALHEESDAASLQSGATGAGLAVERAESGLRDALADAPWVASGEGARLLAAVAELKALAAEDPASPELTQGVEAAAAAMEAAFGLAPR